MSIHTMFIDLLCILQDSYQSGFFKKSPFWKVNTLNQCRKFPLEGIWQTELSPINTFFFLTSDLLQMSDFFSACIILFVFHLLSFPISLLKHCITPNFCLCSSPGFIHLVSPSLYLPKISVAQNQAGHSECIIIFLLICRRLFPCL